MDGLSVVVKWDATDENADRAAARRQASVARAAAVPGGCVFFGFMKWKLITMGKPALEYARVGADEYVRRLQRQTDFTWQVVKGLPREKPAGHFWVVLDERGVQLTTGELRARVDGWEMGAVKHVSVLIGGSDGHDDGTRARADLVLGLSRLTLQHELALVVFLEALYRVYTMKRGEPYHR